MSQATTNYAKSLDFSGRRVLVVGGSSGIGNGIAQAFRSQGAAVEVWGTRPSAADYAGDEGSRLDGLRYRCVDLLVPDAVPDAVPDTVQPGDESFKTIGAQTRISPEQALQGERELDVLVLCQGIVRYQRAEFEMPGFREVMEVNLMSLMRCASAGFEALRQARGSLIVVSSTAAFHATRGNPAYAASKAGAVGLVRTLAQAWAGEGLRVNGIAPGFVDTKLTKVTTANPKRLAAVLERIPAQRLGEPEDMAGAALFLASPLAAYVYGQTLVVDGGLLL
ncbi:MAG: SDR family oxidoreductase [Betaproteobacteria bacterium]|nr:SDR family oxidoreductase [Betaproteobacteria bacterium]NDC02628.1 SDR family oxidoreductase [Betaproteobacteria bacterium]NDC85849.1 SDR family oxidoreductase [Betaproteobacteria bacterium]